NSLGCLLGCDNGVDLEIYEVAPVRYPPIEQTGVVSCHQLIAALKLVIDPTAQIGQALGGHTAAVAEAAIDGHGILVLEVLHHHVQRVWHWSSPVTRASSCRLAVSKLNSVMRCGASWPVG